jgi:tRNA(Ile)-lysidine synthase
MFGSTEFLSEAVVVVAVSGGSDSTALLFRTKENAAPTTRLVAVTIDHGLRPESGGEAAAVAARCAAHGIEHRVSRWEGTKPATGIQAAARLARYALLAEAATDVGARLVLTGHTADDQTETIAMRKQRGEGPGLAGIAPLTLYDRTIWFARPQLGERRDALREWLRHRGIGWIDDPSNSNQAFERVRVRRDLSALTDDEFQQLLQTGVKAAAERVDLGRRAAQLIDNHARSRVADVTSTTSPNPGGKAIPGSNEHTILLGTAFLQEEVAAVHGLRILLAVVGGAEQLPDLQRTEALFRRLRDAERGRFSLARAVIAVQKGEVRLTREQRNSHVNAGDAEQPTMRPPWERLLPWFDMEPARAVDQLLGKTPPPALPWP